MALRHLLLKPLDQTIFFQRHGELFDWIEIEDSIWTWDKNHLTYTRWANRPNRVSSPPYEQPFKKIMDTVLCR